MTSYRVEYDPRELLFKFLVYKNGYLKQSFMTIWGAKNWIKRDKSNLKAVVVYEEEA